MIYLINIHWNFKGEVDKYGDKIELIMIPLLLPFFVYLLFVVIPKIDPKNKLNKMGNKFQKLKMMLTIFLSVLALFILHTVKNQSFTNLNYIVLLIGVLYIILGNYLKTIRANYFLGIRTPWTLENETVWKETHKLGGMMWFIAGIIVVLSSLILHKKLNFQLFFIITGIISITPIAYSYYIHSKIKSKR